MKDALILQPVEPLYLGQLPQPNECISVVKGKDGNLCFATPNGDFAFRISPAQLKHILAWYES